MLCFFIKQDDGIRNVRLAFNIAEEQLEIPQLLDPSDITKGLADERSVMTYLSMIKKAFDHRTTGGVVKMKQDFSIAPVEAATPVTVSTPVVVCNFCDFLVKLLNIYHFLFF